MPFALSSSTLLNCSEVVKRIDSLAHLNNNKNYHLLLHQFPMNRREEIENEKNMYNHLISDSDKDKVRFLIKPEYLQYMSNELFEAMILAFKHLKMTEYLPEFMHWKMFQPLILEALQMFLVRK
jgi:hypothetical protein